MTRRGNHTLNGKKFNDVSLDEARQFCIDNEAAYIAQFGVKENGKEEFDWIMEVLGTPSCQINDLPRYCMTDQDMELPIIVEVSFRRHTHHAGLYARLVWQELFNYYRKEGGSLEQMGDLLCDVDTLEKNFDASDEFTLYWEFGENGYTYMSDEAQSTNAAKIMTEKGKTTIFFPRKRDAS